ncbi:MAG: 5-carboxymethyl-2-hydroxymuconate Delta-isomerase [Pseudomonadota bacterium]
MPHLTIEYSANLDGKADMLGLCRSLHAAILASGLFELGAIRVRAVCCADYAVADLLPENAFADLRLRIGAGRSAEDKARAGEAIFAAAVDCFATLFEAPHFALTLDISELDPTLSWKKNAIHPRLRAK